MRLRDYQDDCCEAVRSAMAVSQAILCVLFTGAGKTVVFAWLAKMFPQRRVLIIAPMRELCWQAAGTVDRVTGDMAELEMASSWARMADEWGWGGRVVVASRQTLLSGRVKRYKRFLGYELVIVDEAHTMMSEPVLEMLKELRDAGATVVGFTATPFRMDGKPLLSFYDTVAFDYGLESGIADWWCLPPVARLVRCADLDLRNVTISQGDFSASDLDAVMGASRPLHQLCLTTQRERSGATIAFLPGVASARAFAELAASQYGLRADWICGNTFLQSEDDRNRIINQFRRGELDVLANCQIATMGFDAPVAQTVILGRPTKSRTLWTQIVGRVTRPEPGSVDGKAWTGVSGEIGRLARRSAILASGKPFFKVIDITDSTASQSIRTAVDMFAKPDTPEPVLREARRLAEEQDGDPEDLLAQAAENVRKAQMLERGLRAMQGQASGRLVGQDIQLGRKKDISEYKVPLRGRYAGKTMGEVDDGYIEWALRQPRLQSWQRSYFQRERARRRALGRHAG